ncbi:MAG TPA: hypothetical protein HPQ04_11975 [Rhodospirillaceae bacterium]|nr:hypothetical protein [Rhodospirillaceae bacterium]
MTDTSPLPASRAALERLAAAVGRLEELAGRPTDDDALVHALDRSRQDYARLEEASRLVEGRLDGVIDRLKLILGD